MYLAPPKVRESYKGQNIAMSYLSVMVSVACLISYPVLMMCSLLGGRLGQVLP